ncbi:MAG: Asp-tRNA(Asn)/Glu-tRNA(Gln) amidotransferase subunit GatC [Planctomycetota bacterium]|nr:Asp-tRNA(Asn)/Glu-tRNA(Gln) amidotransferase subunit GatC [Planctomycetota bacterium]|tara:strand:+ start:3728 stop:4063 length:336 start_codon:yes stop_codon:yes gene_type:complete
MSTPESAGDPAAQISLEQVRHVAELARLAMSDEELESCRGELASILRHIATIDAVDVDGVEPLAHAIDMSNRLSDDEPAESLSIDDVLANAPALEDRFIAVPKVLDPGADE